MILDKDSNTLLFSRLLLKNHITDWNDIQTKLKHNFHLLDDTNDIWIRDFMPIQVSQNCFICFQYSPSYLKNHLELITDQRKICESLDINTIYSSIRLDGGNIVKGYQKIIVTDRIFSENQARKPLDLIKEIESLLEVEVLIFPAEKDDFLGHSDGLVRFLDDKTILINQLSVYPPEFRKNLETAIHKYQLEILEIPFARTKDKVSAVGYYINFLEFQDTIYLPIFQNMEKSNEEAIEILSSLYQDREIVPILLTSIAQDGGLLNCISWSCKTANAKTKEGSWV